jgi:hypothetical protein
MFAHKCFLSRLPDRESRLREIKPKTVFSLRMTLTLCDVQLSDYEVRDGILQLGNAHEQLGRF